MTIYRCIYCGGVTGESPDTTEAEAQALTNTHHGAGICIPDENGLGEQWCEVGHHWSDVIRAHMRKTGNKWCCPEHTGGPNQ